MRSVPSRQAAPGLKLERRKGQDLDRGILETRGCFHPCRPGDALRGSH